ncbi:MAG: flagellar biosynthesis anti-sigma factor FlgM [Gammaproteobacteria bacterium]|nr:flagellar biosynthesis anti-sigma factor FlgM [Gammaproteobacteria bacterium]MDH3507201.1 flagellar biosynthesis anti-sigma factor FlgM [Gammaproteobacteria bacterium]
MADKINGQGFRSIDAAGKSRRPSQTESTSQSANSQSGAAAAPADTVSLTSSAQLLQKLEEILAAAPASDTKRIAALKEAIDSGAYEIDAATIAERLLRMEQDLS